jgi:SAM-dependent methyltransferase
LDTAADRREREQRESDAFDRAAGKAAVPDDRLLIPAREIERYLHALETKHYPIDMLFKKVGMVADLTLLDVGCGTGVWSTILGRLGARVVGADLSETELELASRRARVNGVSSRVSFAKASIHDLPFAAESFDVVFGNAILHHVDPSKAGAEIARVLRAGGRAVFREPVALSLALRRMRKSKLVERIVKESRVSPDEEPLSRIQIESLASSFSGYRIHEMQLISRLSRVITHEGICKILNEVDIKLLEKIPPLRRFARGAILEFVK